MIYLFNAKYTKTPGVLSYFEICEKIRREDWIENYDQLQEVAYAHSDTEWVGYDNETSLKAKVSMKKILNSEYNCYFLKLIDFLIQKIDFIKKSELAGVTIWVIGLNQFLF